MLNLYQLKKKENVYKLKYDSGDLSGKVINTIPANKQWLNSVYYFSKNNLKLLPVASNVITKIIKSYFNMFYTKIEEKKVKSIRKDISVRRKSARKIWTSQPEIKHTYNKLIITMYIYNRQFSYIEDKLKLKMKTHSNKFNILKNKKLKKLIHAMYKVLIENKNVFSYSFFMFTKELLRNNINYLKHKQTMLFNRFKFNIYISGIKYILKRIYRKNIEFNLVSLNNYYLNSNILSQIITTKIRKKKNKALTVLKTSIRNIKTPILNNTTVKRELVKIKEVQNLVVREYNGYLDSFITMRGIKWIENNDLEDEVLKNTKNKLISGITLKASGRITRRITAERAKYVVSSVGTLKNVNSSFKGLSSAMVRGYKKSNLESTQLNSKTHVGAFGIKGWVSSY
uniref:Small ribosomal subunit protein uS3m n=1 Tax=Nadvornikia sorediata TaxID=2575987 RepID=A0A4Y5QK37_9LECA|nr:ribosomal protein S3 [Nadvornikia sorediata]